MILVCLLMLLFPFFRVQAQRAGTQPGDSAAASPMPAMRLTQATPVKDSRVGDTIEVSERELQEALQEIARAVQLNELQRMVAEMAAQQQLGAPVTEQHFEERFDRLERLLFGMAGRLGYTPSVTERRNLIVMPDGSSAVPYPVYPAVAAQPAEDPLLLRQMELLQQQIVLLEQQIADASEGGSPETTATEHNALRLQSLRDEMQRLQQERAEQSRILAVENQRADSLFRAFLAEEQVAASGEPAAGGATPTVLSEETKSDEEGFSDMMAALYQRQLFFPVASDKLSAEAEGALEEVAALLKNQPTLRVSLTGYASPEGERDYNWSLSKQRAEAAAAFLQGKGITSDRIRVISEGVDEQSEMKSYGRRVDVRVLQ